MYAGHLGIALGGKGLRRDAPLWLLVLATQGPDWMQAVACFTGTSAHAMWSHSLPAVLVLAAALAAAGYGVTRNGAVAGLAAAVAVSHALVDYVTGIKPTWPGGPVVGLGLYAHPSWDFLLETAMIVAGWWIYRRSLEPESRSSPLARALLVALIVAQAAGALKLAIAPPATKCF